MVDLSKIRAARFFKGHVCDTLLKQWIMQGYSCGFYSFDEVDCLIRLLELEAA
jgi:hypothetical protein